MKGSSSKFECVRLCLLCQMSTNTVYITANMTSCVPMCMSIPITFSVWVCESAWSGLVSAAGESDRGLW